MANSSGGVEPLIFPIGHYVGAHHTSAGPQQESHRLRIGWELYKLDGPEQLGVWGLAHGMPEGADMAPWTRATVEGAARAAGIPDAVRILDELIGKELLIEVTPGTDHAVKFAQVCRARALLSGLGNTPGEPRLYSIGLAATKPAVTVPTFTYELWKWAPLCDSLWHTCQIFAKTGRETNPADQDKSDPERLLAKSLSAIQVLIAHGATYLDEARELSQDGSSQDALTPIPAVTTS